MCMLCVVQDETELCSGVAAYCVKCIVMCMLCAVQDETELCSGVAAYCVKCIVMCILCAVQGVKAGSSYTTHNINANIDLT
jgi:hypothetical protein